MKSKLQRRQEQPDWELIGPFRAEVVENNDPDRQGKITVKIPELYGNDDVKFVEPKYPLYVQSVPQVGMWTWVTFRHLSRDLPMWEGSWWPDNQAHEGYTGQPGSHVHQIRDSDNEPLFTVYRADEQSQKLQIKEHRHGSMIELDAGTGEINIWSDKSPEGGDSASINLNGQPWTTAYPCARKFDKTVHLCAVLGTPVEGIIKEGSSRVFISNDKNI